MKPKTVDSQDDEMGALPVHVVDCYEIAGLAVFACHWVDQDPDPNNVFILVRDPADLWTVSSGKQVTVEIA